MQGVRKVVLGAQQQNAHLLKDIPSMHSILCFSLRYLRSGMADISSCAMIFYKTIRLSVGRQNVFDPVLWLTCFLIRHSMQNWLQVYSRIPCHLPKWVLSHILFLRRNPKLLWCSSLGHHQFCTSKIGRPNPDQFLIPLTKSILLGIRTFLSDRFLFTQKLRELLILRQGKIRRQGFMPQI
jgi:hypothetical protein